MKERLLNVDAFILDINLYDEKYINGFVNQYFDILSSKIEMSLKFDFKKTINGYTYKILRDNTYQLKGNHVKDIDCAIITGLKTIDFQTSKLTPNKHAVAQCIIPWYDGCYVSEHELEEIYKRIIGTNGAEQPKSVEIHAKESYMTVNVEYVNPNVSVVGSID